MSNDKKQHWRYCSTFYFLFNYKHKFRNAFPHSKTALIVMNEVITFYCLCKSYLILILTLFLTSAGDTLVNIFLEYIRFFNSFLKKYDGCEIFFHCFKKCTKLILIYRLAFGTMKIMK